MNIEPPKPAWISDKQRKTMLELILIRYRKQTSFTAQMGKKIEQFENQIFLKIHKAEAESVKLKFNHYQTTCLKSVEKMFKEKLEDLFREYNAMLNTVSVAKTTVATGKRPFGLIQDPTMVRQSKRRKLETNDKHHREGLATRLGASIKTWRKCFNKFLEFSPQDHPYRSFAHEGIGRCERLTRRLAKGDFDRVYDSEKAEDLYQKLNIEVMRLQQKQSRLGTLKPQGFDKLISTFESLRAENRTPESYDVIPDVVNFLHRTQPSNDGTFKVVQGPVLDTICPVNPKKTWAGLYRAAQNYTYDDD